MIIKRITPVPPAPTYDIIGLTADEASALLALLSGAHYVYNDGVVSVGERIYQLLLTAITKQ
jgi:hypothetical protein